jgi:hypothetical protein
LGTSRRLLINSWCQDFISDIGIKDFILSDWLLPLCDNSLYEEITISETSIDIPYIKTQHGGLNKNNNQIIGSIDVTNLF